MVHLYQIYEASRFWNQSLAGDFVSTKMSKGKYSLLQKVESGARWCWGKMTLQLLREGWCVVRAAKTLLQQTHATSNMKRQEPLPSFVIFFPSKKLYFPLLAVSLPCFSVSWCSRPVLAAMKLPIKAASYVCWLEEVNASGNFAKDPLFQTRLCH